MAKITIAGDAAVITSAAKLEDIKLLEKYSPDALCLFDENSETGRKEVSFRVGTTAGKGSVGTFGASFGSAAHDGTGLATITMGLPAGVTDANAAEKVADALGTAILKLKKVEEQIAPAVAAVAEEKAAIMEDITVVS